MIFGRVLLIAPWFDWSVFAEVYLRSDFETIIMCQIHVLLPPSVYYLKEYMVFGDLVFNLGISYSRYCAGRMINTIQSILLSDPLTRGFPVWETSFWKTLLHRNFYYSHLERQVRPPLWRDQFVLHPGKSIRRGPSILGFSVPVLDISCIDIQCMSAKLAIYQVVFDDFLRKYLFCIFFYCPTAKCWQDVKLYPFNQSQCKIQNWHENCLYVIPAAGNILHRSQKLSVLFSYFALQQ